MKSVPLLSAVLVVGPRRQRSQRSLDALGRQTRAADMEIVVVDVAEAGTPALVAPVGVRTVYLARPGLRSFVRARAEGFRRAQAAIVAGIEDHCFAEPEWAAALIDAYQGPWAAVGYAFRGANQDGYVARACLVADYGVFMHPLRSAPSAQIPSSNVSYRRATLMALDVDGFLEHAMDVNIHDALLRQGQQMFVESRAVVAHQNFERFFDMMQGNYSLARLFAAYRATQHGWSPARRLLWGLMAPLAVPPLRLMRLLRSVRGRPWLLPQVLAASPVIVATFCWTAVVEGLGYLFGVVDGEARFVRWELEVDRGPIR